jgi:sarcosine oxidase subunit beta
LTADVAIVGAGVLGASIAWHLGALGVRDVVLFDRGAPGQGSTARATGGFRAQFGTELEVRLALLAREKLRRFRDEVGVDSGYEAHGYLWLARTSAQLEVLRAANAVQRACGLVEARILESAEIGAVNPAVRGEFAGGAWCPTDGFLRALRILDGYLSGAQRQGAQVRTGAPVEAFRVERGKVTALRVAGEEVPCGTVVVACGAWSAPVAGMAGVLAPVSPLRRQVALTEPTSALPASMPLTIFVDDGFHFRVRDGRVLLLLPTPGNPGDPFDASVEPQWLDGVARIARERVPVLAGVPIDLQGSWAGLYEMTPDHLPLLGFSDVVENLFLACGCSGHGVMLSPALGQLAAELLAGRTPSLPVEALRPGRFHAGSAAPAAALL